MEIKLNTNVYPIGRVATSQPKKSDAKVEGESAVFDKSAAMDQALRSLPDSRAEVVAKAQEKTATPAYPSPETIKQVSTLLAKSIEDSETNQ